jgi:hypothetical protein
MSASNEATLGKRDVSIDLTPSQTTKNINTAPGHGPASSPTRLPIAAGGSGGRTSSLAPRPSGRILDTPDALREIMG